MAQAQAPGRLKGAILAAAFVLAWNSGFIAGTLGTRTASGVRRTSLSPDLRSKEEPMFA
jgi:hypothetical protein